MFILCPAEEVERICSQGNGTENKVDEEEEGSEELESIRNYAYHLATCRPSMAPLANAAAGALAAVHKELLSRAGPFEITKSEVRSICQHVSSLVNSKMGRYFMFII